MTQAEQDRELALVNFMERVNQFCATMKVRMCRGIGNPGDGCNLHQKVLDLEDELRVMSAAHIKVMREHSLPRHKAGVDNG